MTLPAPSADVRTLVIEMARAYFHKSREPASTAFCAALDRLTGGFGVAAPETAPCVEARAALARLEAAEIVRGWGPGQLTRGSDGQMREMTQAELIDAAMLPDPGVARALSQSAAPAQPAASFEARVEAATRAVRDEIGSRLCNWTDLGTERTCTKETKLGYCMCARVAESAVISADAVGAPATVPAGLIERARGIKNRHDTRDGQGSDTQIRWWKEAFVFVSDLAALSPDAAALGEKP